MTVLYLRRRSLVLAAEKAPAETSSSAPQLMVQIDPTRDQERKLKRKRLRVRRDRHLQWERKHKLKRRLQQQLLLPVVLFQLLAT
jgi:hypothetical protein